MGMTYGCRDSYDRDTEKELQAPSGRGFTQNRPETYARIDLDAVQRPSGYRQEFGPRKRPGNATQGTMHGESGRIVQPNSHRPEDYLGFRVASRVRDGVHWVVTYEGPDGKSHTVRRLAATREGYG